MKYCQDVVIIENEQDIKTLEEKYECHGLDELDDLLWFNYGVTLQDKRKPINAA